MSNKAYNNSIFYTLRLRGRTLNKTCAVAYVNNQWYYIKARNLCAAREACMKIGKNPPANFPPPPIPRKKKTGQKSAVKQITREFAEHLIHCECRSCNKIKTKYSPYSCHMMQSQTREYIRPKDFEQLDKTPKKKLIGE